MILNGTYDSPTANDTLKSGGAVVVGLSDIAYRRFGIVRGLPAFRTGPQDEYETILQDGK